MTQSVNMINTACDNTNPGWGSYSPNSARPGEHAGNIQLGVIGSRKKYVDVETSPGPNHISECLLETKKDGPQGMEFSDNNCVTNDACKQANQDLKLSPQVMKVRRNLLTALELAIVQGGRYSRELNDVTAGLGNVKLGGGRHKPVPNNKSRKPTVLWPTNQLWLPYPQPPPLRRNHNTTHPPWSPWPRHPGP